MVKIKQIKKGVMTIQNKKEWDFIEFKSDEVLNSILLSIIFEILYYKLYTKLYYFFMV